MLTRLARTTALLAAGLLAAATARAQAPAPSSPVVPCCPVARGDAGQDTQVVLEVRLVSVPDQFFERIGVDFNVNTAPTPAWTCTRDCATPVCEPQSGPVFLSAKQVALFLEGVQGDPRSNIMQAPKITALNGQTVQVDSTEKQFFVTGAEVVQVAGRPVVVPKNEEVTLGFHMSACPKVSADGRSVLLNLEINQTDLAFPVVPLCSVTMLLKDDQGRDPVQFTQFLQQPKLNTMRIEKRLVIPDGGTVLLGGGKKEVEVRSEFGPPILSKVPYVNRLFKNVGTARETQTVYVLVTPRVIVNEEEEPREHTKPVSRPPVTLAPVSVVPRELVNQHLPPYVIEPPDVLLVEVVPHEDTPKDGQQIHGQHLVRPDGTIGLGDYGSAFVGGMTTEQARQAVAEQIRKRTNKFDTRDLNVNVLAFNSKCYYVVTDVGGHGEQVYRFPITGSETVLDALGRTPGLPPVSNKGKVWVARRGGGEAGQVLPVDWYGIVQRGATSTNYQLMPGDRVYVNMGDAPYFTKAGATEEAESVVKPAPVPVNPILSLPCCGPVSATVKAPSRQVKVVEELVKAYDEACAAGHTEDAAKLARAALILDPTCFAKPRGR